MHGGAESAACRGLKPASGGTKIRTHCNGIAVIPVTSIQKKHVDSYVLATNR